MKSTKIRLSLLVVIFATAFMCLPISVNAEDLFFPKKIGVIVNEETSETVWPMKAGIKFDKIKISNLKILNKK